MPIKGLSEKRRLPRMGKIKLGIKAPNKSGGGEHPEETDYFVCPEIVQRAYSEKPKELIIIFPTEDDEIFFPQYLKRWGNGVLLCKGDGEKANCWDYDQGGLKEIDCPCDYLKERKCKASATLKFLLPEVEESAGIFEIETGNRASIEDINSGIAYIRSITKGRIAWIPIKLIRAPMIQHRVEDKKLTASTHYPIKLSLEGLSLQALIQYTQLDPRELLLPAADAIDSRDIAAAPQAPATGQSGPDRDPGKPAEPSMTPSSPQDAGEDVPPEPQPAAVDQGFEETEAEALEKELARWMEEYTEAGGTINSTMQMKAESLTGVDQFKTQIKFYEQQIRQIKNRDKNGQGRLS